MAIDDLTKHIKVLEGGLIGEGGFAVVQEGLLWQSPQQGDKVHVAVKYPNPRCIDSTSDGMSKLTKRWNREITAGGKVSHPNVVQIFGICANPISRYRELFGIVMPFCANGDARKYISRYPATADRLWILCGAASALFALHTSSPPVVHGDIKAENILIDDNGNALLSDFGLARICEMKGFTTNSHGTLRWMAGELFDEDVENKPTRTTTESDIWAFAMTILEILTGRYPFIEITRAISVPFAVRRGERPKRPPFITDAVWELLEYCWRKEPNTRPDARHVGLVLDITRGRGDDLSPDTVSNILEGKFDTIPCLDHGAQNSESSLLPYKCKWPRCPRSFATMDGCIEHECAEFENRRKISNYH